MDDFSEFIPKSQGSVHICCPSCSEGLTVDPVVTLEPNSPELAELFQGSLNRETCSACGAGFALTVPLVYRDDENGLLVYLMPLEDGQTWQEAERRVDALTQKIFIEENGMTDLQCRLVLTRSEMIEKIALHTRGLNDRIVEYIKYQFFQHPDEGRRIDPAHHRLLFDFSSDQEENLSFLVFDTDAGTAAAGAHLPMEDYRDVVEMMVGQPALAEELKRLFPGSYVNVHRLLGGVD